MTTFSKEERLAISLKNVLTDIGYNGLGTAIPDDSGDSAFLLSVAEAMNPAYFPRGDDDRILEADWWLRSAGTWGYRAAIVLIAYGGGIEFPGFDVTQSYAIRPAFKLHLPL